MNRKNVKGGKRVYKIVGHNTSEVAHEKSPAYSTFKKCENVDLCERNYSVFKRDGDFEEVLPSARDLESCGLFGMFHSYVGQHGEQNARVKEQIERHPGCGGCTAAGRSPMCNPPTGSQNSTMSRRRPKHYRKGSNKPLNKQIPSPGNSECVRFLHNNTHFSDDKQIRQSVSSVDTNKPKSPVNIKKSCDSDSDICATSNFDSDALFPNQNPLLDPIFLSSGNTSKAKTSGLENNDIYSDRISCEGSSLSEHHVDPHTAVSKCTSEINHLSDLCLTNHGKALGEISLKLTAAKDNKGVLNILSSRKTNMLLQQNCFNDFILHVHKEVVELFSECNSDSVTTKTKEIISKVRDECKLFSFRYPAYSLNQVLKATLANYQVTVISCDVTYCSNIVVPLLLRNTFRSGMIASCEINEAVALFSAQNCCYLMDQKLSQLVGYDTGPESFTSKNTKIIFTTVKELFSYSLNDPHFSKYSCIVLNDFLYRSIETDILLAALRECLNKRDDLRIVVLVATKHNIENLKHFFSRKDSDNVSVISTEHVNFPVQVIWKQSFCKPDDDVILEAVNICFSIHVRKSNDRGNVLVFLPTEKDAAEVAELTMQKFCEYSFTDVFCTYISKKSKLKKMLQIWGEQQQSKRTIIFMSSNFEVVLFPNVRYVVDCGRTNEVSYDTEKKIEIQKMSFISQRRSEIRKKCAGMYTSGICFRMYSKNNYKKSMVYDESPEVLSRSPLNSLIRIFKFIPDSALATKFIESFSEEVQENALRALQSLGALENGRLTLLGEYLVKLPFPPEYSKLLVLGKQQGLLFETIILVSFFSVNLGDVFQNKSTEDLNKKVDAAKLCFLQNDSDTLTFLNIYRQWVESEYSESWCADNYIEVSFLHCIRAKIKEVCKIIENVFGGTVLEKFSNDCQIAPDVCSSLQQIIFECFRDHLCVYSGHFTSGYQSLTANCSVFLHPLTFIAEKGSPPQFIVYNKFISKTHNFITHVTALPDSYVTDACDQGLMKFRRDALFDQKLVPHVIDPVGLSIIKHALTKEKLRDLKEQINKETESEFIVIEPSEEKGSVTLYCLPDKWCKAEEIMRKFLDESMEQFRDEEETQILELQKGNSTVSVNIVWSKGAEISSVVVDAQQDTRLDCHSDSSCDTISLSETSVAHNSHSCVLLTWLRRPCVGDGYVEFNSSVDFYEARKLAMNTTKTVVVKGASVEVEVVEPEKYRLVVHGLDPETVDEDLEIAFKENLPGVSLSDAKVIRRPPFQTNSDEIEVIEELLKNQCQYIFSRNVILIKVHKPENVEVTMTAEAQPVRASNMCSVEDLAGFLNGVLKVHDVNVKAKVSYYTFLFCSTDIWDKVQPCIDCAYNSYVQKLKKNDMGCDIEIKMLDSQTQRIKIASENEKNVSDLREVVQKLLEGFLITSADNSCLPTLFCHGGQLFLHALKSRTNVCIIDDYKTKTIRLYGSEENCKVAKHDIMEYLTHVEEETVHIESLDRGENSRTLLRTIIQTYDVELREFIEVCKLRSAELNIQQCELTLRGTAESIEEAKLLLRKLEEPELDFAQNLLPFQERCPLCLYDVFTHAIRLEGCGHSYCRVCCKRMVTTSKFPVKCSVKECNKVIILEDIRRIFDYNAEEIKVLLRRSLTHYISCNQNFGYCPVPDCPMFVDMQHIPEDNKWNCSLCHNDICCKCKVIYHDGFDCDVYEGMKTDSDYAVKVWRKGKNCKECPKCGMLIEKQSGCNHMICCGCKAEFCWRCRKCFKNEMEMMLHQSSCVPEQL